MTISLIYAYWPNQPFGITWCDLPWALRDAGLPKRLNQAGHEVLETILMAEDDFPEELHSGFQLAGQIAAEVTKAKSEGELAVILCGSCALAAIGGVSGLGGGDETGIAWFDAHPDLNTPETTTSGLLEGMALAAATGNAWTTMAKTYAGLQPATLAHTALFGARDIDPAEQALLDAHGVPLAQSAAAINTRLTGTRHTYVHLDMDVHNALMVRTNATPAPNGPSAEHVRATLTKINRTAVLGITGLDPAAQDSKAASEIAIGHILAVAQHHAQSND